MKTTPKTVQEVIELLQKQDPSKICEVNFPCKKGRNIAQIADIDETDPTIVTIFVEDLD